MTTETKECSGCRRTLPLTEYHKDKTKPDGLHTRCRDCKSKKPRQQPLVRPVLDPKALAQREAARRALIRLVQHHRTEYDTLVYRERMKLQYPAEKQAS